MKESYSLISCEMRPDAGFSPKRISSGSHKSVRSTKREMTIFASAVHDTNLGLKATNSS
jgi:hypothetical protein